MDEPARPDGGTNPDGAAADGDPQSPGPDGAPNAASRAGDVAPEPPDVAPEPPDVAPEPPVAPFVERRSTTDGRRLRPPTPRVALLLFGAIVLAFVLYLGREALSPFVVGLLAVYLLNPPVERLSRFMPRILAILIVYMVVAFAIVEALSLTLAPLVNQISQLVKNLPALAQSFDDQLRRLSDVYRGLDLPSQIRDLIDSALADAAGGIGGFDPGVLLPVFGSVASFIGVLFGYFLIPVWVFYILKDRRQLTGAFDRSLPVEWRADTWEVIRIVERVFGQWVRAQILLGVTVGVATYVGLLILGATVHPVFSTYALLLAIIAGLFELLPIIGPIIAAIPAILLAATAGLQPALAALLLYFLVQQVENNLLVPKIQGDAVELHPSAVMFALVVGGSIAGLLGAILALPITAAGRNVFRYLFRRLSQGPLGSPLPTTSPGLKGEPMADG